MAGIDWGLTCGIKLKTAMPFIFLLLGWFPSSSFTAIKLRVAISQRRECKACLAWIYR